ncbi:hypothetical protein WS90_07485 [Burkholderia cepacia]|uniref:Uncharacterized protein n=1 Tax=Burkholderia cepacia TaxID=292 RepID=A0A118KL37_BURCE|nr:hypothetical protein WS90_07485 [Burkholderia cepacia]
MPKPNGARARRRPTNVNVATCDASTHAPIANDASSGPRVTTRQAGPAPACASGSTRRTIAPDAGRLA